MEARGFISIVQDSLQWMETPGESNPETTSQMAGFILRQIITSQSFSGRLGGCNIRAMHLSGHPLARKVTVTSILRAV